MISHKYKCIFIEVPKTGSTSIRKILGYPIIPHLDLMQSKKEMINSFPYRNGYGILRRLDSLYKYVPLQLRNKITDNRFSNYFKFGFVRNPWDRVVSQYFRKEGIKMSKRISFEEFVKWIENSSDTSIHTSVHKNQLDWFTNEDGEVIADFIGKFERLNDDFEIARGKLGFNEGLLHANKSKIKRNHYTEYYNPKTSDIIAEKFKVDIEYFGYEFGK